MNNKKYGKLNNAGTSLVELLVVIAILSILTGGVGLGISMAFSKDAEQCATLINDSLKEARMLSMSKKGKYTITFTTESIGGNSIYVAKIENADNPAENKTIYLEGGENKKIATIKVGTIDETTGSITGAADVSSTPVVLVFDKAKGNVDKDTSLFGTESIATDSIIAFDITQSRGTKTAKVQLVPNTGKHTVGEFK